MKKTLAALAAWWAGGTNADFEIAFALVLYGKEEA